MKFDRLLQIAGLLALALLLPPLSQAHAGPVVDGTLIEARDSGGTPIGTSVDYIFFDAPAGLLTIDVRSWEFSDLTFLPVDVNGDGEFAFFDPHIFLFVDDGSLDAGDLIAGSDDNFSFPGSGTADGSVGFVDPFFSPSLVAGSYVLAIGAAPGFTAEKALSGTDTDTGKLSTISPFGFPAPGHDHGDYRVTFSDGITVTGSATSVVPEPSTFALFASGLLGTLGFAWHRRRQRGVRGCEKNAAWN